MAKVHTIGDGQVDLLFPNGKRAIHAVCCKSPGGGVGRADIEQFLDDDDNQSWLPAGSGHILLLFRGQDDRRLCVLSRGDADSDKWGDEYGSFLCEAVEKEREKLTYLILESELQNTTSNRNAVTSAMSAQTHQNAAALAVPASGVASGHPGQEQSLTVRFDKNAAGNVTFRASGDVGLASLAFQTVQLGNGRDRGGRLSQLDRARSRGKSRARGQRKGKKTAGKRKNRDDESDDDDSEDQEPIVKPCAMAAKAKKKASTRSKKVKATAKAASGESSEESHEREIIMNSRRRRDMRPRRDMRNRHGGPPVKSYASSVDDEGYELGKADED
ncbi:hypothetical protein THAOC_37175 [Thalassiosira oceanica]|uniref:Uncharacterized protein n=1 Tax=Thalassiosira oceanica TaxID=159749 RepID=K0QYP5_THAOC|nr:hypothetical protein THAOC_37175 [Thalassiosira oceanica]|eukprot:EJK44298.1 hypothetical protein THAOC_37175 [Thalassiosira oceanica]